MGTYLFQRISSDDGKDSRFDKIRTSPSKFYVAFFAQATWVSLCTLPVILVNALPRSAFALSASTLPALASAPYLTDILGLILLIPLSRALVRRVLVKRFADRMIVAARSRAGAATWPPPRGTGRPGDVEGTAVDVDADHLPRGST